MKLPAYKLCISDQLHGKQYEFDQELRTNPVVQGFDALVRAASLVCHAFNRFQPAVQSQSPETMFFWAPACISSFHLFLSLWLACDSVGIQKCCSERHL